MTVEEYKSLQDRFSDERTLRLAVVRVSISRDDGDYPVDLEMLIVIDNELRKKYIEYWCARHYGAEYVADNIQMLVDGASKIMIDFLHDNIEFFDNILKNDHAFIQEEYESSAVEYYNKNFLEDNDGE